MEKTSFVYVTYIISSPEKVWSALIDKDITGKYWQDPLAKNPAHINVSKWEVGSEWNHQRLDEAKTIDITGKVIEFTPPTRLVISWARPSEANEEEKHSKVTFELEPVREGLVKLVVTHDDLDPQMKAGVSVGWPQVLSNLKSYLELGHPLT